MNKIDKLINEMGKELLPSLSSKEDLVSLSQLRKLYKKDLVEFDKKLKRVNTVRKAEGLEPLHKNEIIGKSVKQDIKKVVKEKKYDIIGNKRIDKLNAKDLTQWGDVGNNISKWKDFIKDVPNGGKIINDIISKKNKTVNKRARYAHNAEHYLKTVSFKSFGKLFYILTFFDSEPRGVYNSPTPYKIVDGEVRFPELKKKIDFKKSEYLGNLKIRKL